MQDFVHQQCHGLRNSRILPGVLGGLGFRGVRFMLLFGGLGLGLKLRVLAFGCED